MTNATAPTREQELTEKLALLKSEHADIRGEAQRLEAEAVKAESGVRALVEDLAHPLDSAGISRARQLVDELRQGATDLHARAAAFSAKNQIPQLQGELEQIVRARSEEEARQYRLLQKQQCEAEIRERAKWLEEHVVVQTAVESRLADLMREAQLLGVNWPRVFMAAEDAKTAGWTRAQTLHKNGQLMTMLPARSPES